MSISALLFVAQTQLQLCFDAFSGPCGLYGDLVPLWFNSHRRHACAPGKLLSEELST
jgi:hypothetical protein